MPSRLRTPIPASLSSFVTGILIARGANYACIVEVLFFLLNTFLMIFTVNDLQASCTANASVKIQLAVGMTSYFYADAGIAHFAERARNTTVDGAHCVRKSFLRPAPIVCSCGNHVQLVPCKKQQQQQKCLHWCNHPMQWLTALYHA